MVDYSQNMWVAFPSSDTRLDKNFAPVNGQKFPQGVLKGDVEFIFADLVKWFNAEIEPIVAGWNWGHNYREVRALAGIEELDVEEELSRLRDQSIDGIEDWVVYSDRDNEDMVRDFVLEVEELDRQGKLGPNSPCFADTGDEFHDLDNQIRTLTHELKFGPLGATGLSNHSSGTAIDINAPKHPLGAVGTFAAHLVAKIRARLRDVYKGVVRWGGDYSGRKDEMHFEINANAAAVKAVADEIRGGGSTNEGGFEVATVAEAVLEELNGKGAKPGVFPGWLVKMYDGREIKNTVTGWVMEFALKLLSQLPRRDVEAVLTRTKPDDLFGTVLNNESVSVAHLKEFRKFRDDILARLDALEGKE